MSGKGLTDQDYPERVPILEPSGMCRGAFHKGLKRDLTGWRWYAFRGHLAASEHVRQLIVAEIERRKGPDRVTVFCDGATYAEAADVWNTVMRSLGYVVPCYRAKAAA